VEEQQSSPKLSDRENTSPNPAGNFVRRIPLWLAEKPLLLERQCSI